MLIVLTARVSVVSNAPAEGEKELQAPATFESSKAAFNTHRVRSTPWGSCAVVAALVSLCAGCSSSATATSTAPTTVQVGKAATSVGLSDVSLSNGKVVVDEAIIPLGGGFVVVYADAGGAPGKQVGVSRKLAAGPHRKFSIDVNSTESAFWAVVHRDVNADGSFDPSTDTAFSDPATGLVATRHTN
jgi:hypothetical protein